MESQGFQRILNHSEHDIICTANAVVQVVEDDINKHCEGKALVELGCNDGAWESRLKCSSYVGVDLYSSTDKVVKQDWLEYLNSQPDRSLDVVMAKCSTQFFKYADI